MTYESSVKVNLLPRPFEVLLVFPAKCHRQLAPNTCFIILKMMVKYSDISDAFYQKRAQRLNLFQNGLQAVGSMDCSNVRYIIYNERRLIEGILF